MRFKLMNPLTEEHLMRRKAEAWESLTERDCIQTIVLCGIICVLGLVLLRWDATWMLGICITALTGPTSVFFLIWWLAVVRRNPPLPQKNDQPACNSCGYSLTGNTSGTCPECGSPIPKAPEPKSPRPV